MTQPTQYAAADGARLSILATLDMSKKELAVGAPENYLFTLEPRLHGLDDPDAPSLVAVLIVNGNSRRRALVTPEASNSAGWRRRTRMNQPAPTIPPPAAAVSDEPGR